MEDGESELGGLFQQENCWLKDFQAESLCRRGLLNEVYWRLLFVCDAWKA
jgi:hypothetical protein